MIGLDTNIIVRYLTQDDPEQSKTATRLIETQLSATKPGFITMVTLVEVSWVLESCYNLAKAEVVHILQGILATKQFLVERADLAYLALKHCASARTDFSDTLIATVCSEHNCTKVLTFDKKARGSGMELL
ncbi:PIN domain-containing protein [Microbulbifer rhizosphaerae]|uniref:Putative nucleic-acid-binding protein n=1 Tax=Microbulbifer rhizosphaerae TaxID=1562603 RepID=A0A7W4Z9L6_9GAMM|nr:type II toxin-antitoxin system VapC family toxin [Microbulbifer rhizosphaerae]MBB3061963.1 putative nucleic-acid-binding protein [Microbulbifer rhizosphaerae]